MARHEPPPRSSRSYLIGSSTAAALIDLLNPSTCSLIANRSCREEKALVGVSAGGASAVAFVRVGGKLGDDSSVVRARARARPRREAAAAIKLVATTLF